MGKKYSINSAGYAVAERGIYSLGGFIPKGSVGGKVASEKQLSQDGECWLGGGDISTNENVRIRDNAFVQGLNVPASTQADEFIFDGDTFVGGVLTVSVSTSKGHKSDLLMRDSFIGTEMNVLCGASATAFTFEQGSFNNDAAAGTAFGNMKVTAADICRTTAILRVGRNTQIYIPTGLNCRVLWGYFSSGGTFTYSGESFATSTALTKLEHPVYKLCMVHIAQADGNAMTPAQLEAKGARIIGHVSGDLSITFKPASASGTTVMVNSSLTIQTSNFGLSINAIRWLAGKLINTDVYTVDRQDLKVFGTFRNVGRLEYIWYISDSSLAKADRDTIVQAYDCPLLRLRDNTLSGALFTAGGPTFRNCVVPKGIFGNDTIEGNIYEDIDFSYAQEHLGKTFIGNTLASSHRQGLYAVSSNNGIVGFVSRPENAADGAYIGPDAKDDPLDGSVIEQGTYNDTLVGQYYEDTKTDLSNHVRTRVPFSTEGAYLPTMPSGFKIAVACYLDENFILADAKTDPTSVSSDYPYFVLAFRKSDNSAITPKNFAALNLYIRSYDYSSVPTVSGSGFIGEGCNVRGDVEVIGQSYVNRVLDVNLWERGTTGAQAPTWEESKGTQVLPHRVRLVDTIRVRPGDTVTCKDAYYVECNAFDGNGQFLSRSAWVKSYKVPENASFLGLVLRLVSDGYMDESDIQTAEVRYVTEFKTENYITNKLSRVSPSDVLLGPDYWENKVVNNVQASDGKPYDTIKVSNDKALILKKPINILNSTLTTYIAKGFTRGNYRFDANTKFYYSLSSPVNSAIMSFVVQREPSGVLQPSDIADAQLRINYVPTPRIVKPYGSTGIAIQKTRVRLYDNAVLSLQLASGQDVVLKDNAIMGNIPGACVCGNGHDDAIIKLPWYSAM